MKRIIFALFFSFFALAIWSQSADDIVAKYLESIGGAEKWKALKTVKLIGTVPTPQGDFTFEMLRKAPNKFIISLDVMGQKFVPQAYDGEVGWRINPFMGDPNPQKIPEEEMKSVRQEADFEDPFLDYAAKGNDVSYEGTADVDGVNCYQLKLTKNKGKADEEVVMNYFLDSETYLPIMVKQTPSEGQMAGQEMNVYYSDYQDAGDGLLMPYTIDTKVGGQSVQAIKFTAIELNTDISDDAFKYPGQ
jgi:outer membrane lipoprotein-sorting protein